MLKSCLCWDLNCRSLKSKVDYYTHYATVLISLFFCLFYFSVKFNRKVLLNQPFCYQNLSSDKRKCLRNEKLMITASSWEHHFEKKFDYSVFPALISVRSFSDVLWEQLPILQTLSLPFCNDLARTKRYHTLFDI